MVWLDGRLPVRFGTLDSLRADETVLTDRSPAPARATTFAVQVAAPEALHGAGCACCLPRNGAATALAALFRTRAMSKEAPFRGVLAVVGAAGEAEVRAALEADPLVAARYRIG